MTREEMIEKLEKAVLENDVIFPKMWHCKICGARDIGNFGHDPNCEIGQLLTALREPKEKSTIRVMCSAKQAGKMKALLESIVELKPAKIEIVEPKEQPGGESAGITGNMKVEKSSIPSRIYYEVLVANLKADLDSQQAEIKEQADFLSLAKEQMDAYKADLAKKDKRIEGLEKRAKEAEGELKAFTNMSAEELGEYLAGS